MREKCIVVTQDQVAISGEGDRHNESTHTAFLIKREFTVTSTGDDHFVVSSVKVCVPLEVTEMALCGGINC